MELAFASSLHNTIRRSISTNIVSLPCRLLPPLQIRVLDTPPLEYPDQTSSYLYILTKEDDGAAAVGGDGRGQGSRAHDAGKGEDASAASGCSSPSLPAAPRQTAPL